MSNPSGSSARAAMIRPRHLVKSLAGALVSVCVLLLLEVVLRVGAFIWHDYNQYYLYYGVHSLVGRAGISSWHTSGGRHYKFPPDYILRGAAGQAEETAAINSSGFRGPDFQSTKPPGTFRIACLGESSTFGFHNKDDETYPVLLQKLFEQRPGTPRVEVINAGFPYYNSGSILSLLQADILGLQPDVLTVYSAYNDAGWPIQEGLVTNAAAWLHAHSMAYFLMKEVMSSDRVAKRLGRTPRRAMKQNVDRNSFDTHTSQIVARYRANYEAIIATARDHGIPIILIKQPMTARLGHIQRLGYSRSYEGEYQDVMKKVEANEPLSSVEYQLLVHHRLVDELQAIAKRERIDLVDNVAIVDQDRRLMASYVHLTAEANLRLAKALKPAIERYLTKQPQAVTHSQSLQKAQ